MPGRTPPIARIALARSLPRILAVPVLLAVLGVGLPIAAALAPIGLGTMAVLVAAGVGAGLLLVALLMLRRPLTARLEVEEAAVRVSWLGGARDYPLTPGPVTRVRFRGPAASSLRPRSGGPGWSLGPARLRDEEDIEVVRLAPTETAILVPTERGRLAVSARSEDELLDALSRAARARRRLEELDTGPRQQVAPQTPPAPSAPDAAEVTPPEPEPHVLTGIERALLEERLAREGAAGTAGVPSAAPTPSVATADTAATPADAPRTARLARPRPSAALVLLPLVAAGLVWGIASLTARLPEPATDLGRLTSLGLVLSGPATSIGAIMALVWWPRIVGVVVAGGLVATVFVGRALLGAV